MENSEKVKIAMDNLSTERKNHIHKLIENSINPLKNNANQNMTYQLEITERFDKEEPHQFVWMSFNFSLQHLGFLIPNYNGGMIGAVQAHASITDMEIYSPPDIDGWLDHVQRIKDLQSKNLLKNDEDKKEETSNNTVIINNQNEIDMNDENDDLDEQKAIEELEYLFSPLFSSPYPKSHSNEDYIKIFQKYSAIFANRVMAGFINMQDEPISLVQNRVNEALVMLTSEFENCDFTKFSKEQLETLGFVNWKNKILMIPIWAYPIILKNNKGLILNDIKGEEWFVGKDYIFTEDKNGVIAVGIPFKKTSNSFEVITDYLK